jgi:hypothetical protein
MAKYGDKHDVGGHERTYYSDKWDLIQNKSTGEYQWRDKENHQSYEHDGSVSGVFLNDSLGEETSDYDSDGEDNVWDDE